VIVDGKVQSITGLEEKAKETEEPEEEKLLEAGETEELLEAVNERSEGDDQ